jgi:hypothetical protein
MPTVPALRRPSHPLPRTALALACGLAACTPSPPAGDGAVTAAAAAPNPSAMDQVAESYVKLALALGAHDPDYVDAYYGPKAWRDGVDSTTVPLAEVPARAAALRTALAATPQSRDSMVTLRREYLDRQLASMAARVGVLQGRRLPFDEESRALYDAVAPINGEPHFQALIARLDAALPGTGPVPARYEAFRQRFVIPRQRLDSVFQAAIAGCRERTAATWSSPRGSASRWST